MDSSTFESVIHLFTEKLGVSRDRLQAEARLVEDIGMDSVDRVQLTIAIEQEFGVRVPEDQIDGLLVVSDVVQMVERLRIAAPREATTNGA